MVVWMCLCQLGALRLIWKPIYASNPLNSHIARRIVSRQTPGNPTPTTRAPATMLPKNTEDETTPSESTITSNSEPMSLEPTVGGDMDALYPQILPTAHVVKIRLIDERSRIPQKATAGAAAFDVYARRSASLGGEAPMIVPLGFCLQMPHGMYARLHGRSGHALKGITVHEGIIDEDYTGEVGLIMTALQNRGLGITEGDRVGQITFHHCLPVEFEQVSEIRETARGAGGFGSTGASALFRPTHNVENSSHMESARQACLDVVQSPLGKRESPTRKEDEEPRSPPALDASTSSGACEMALAPPPLPVITLSAAPEEPTERPTAATTGGVWR